MAKDEWVNGPEIAARILDQMPSSSRNKIIETMAKCAPQAATLVQAKMSYPASAFDVETISSIVGTNDQQELAKKIADVIKKMIQRDNPPEP